MDMNKLMEDGKLVFNNLPNEEIKQICEFVDQQEKYAELGRLALQTRGTVCKTTAFKTVSRKCEEHCFNINFCQKRAELLDKTEVNEY